VAGGPTLSDARMAAHQLVVVAASAFQTDTPKCVRVSHGVDGRSVASRRTSSPTNGVPERRCVPFLRIMRFLRQTAFVAATAVQGRKVVECNKSGRRGERRQTAVTLRIGLNVAVVASLLFQASPEIGAIWEICG